MQKSFNFAVSLGLVVFCSSIASAAEQFVSCHMTRDALSNGVHEPSEYDLRIMLDDARKTIKTDDIHGVFTVITVYNDLEIKGRMEPFEFSLDRETGGFARAAKTVTGAIVESGKCKKISRPKPKF